MNDCELSLNDITIFTIFHTFQKVEFLSPLDTLEGFRHFRFTTTTYGKTSDSGLTDKFSALFAVNKTVSGSPAPKSTRSFS